MATIADTQTWTGVATRPAWIEKATGSITVRILLIAAVTTLIGVLFAIPMWSDPGYFKQELCEWWAWGILFPVVAWADGKLPFDARKLGRRSLAHVALGLIITGVYLHVFFVLRALLHNFKWEDLAPSRMLRMGNLGWYIWSLLVYALIAGALQAYAYYRRYMNSQFQVQRLEKSYTQARLNALRMQLDPHFLFNALNTISSHVERDPRLTRRMIEHLGDLLRMSLETKDRQEVPLAEELAFLDHYLEIQRIRFGDQLQVELDIAPEVRYAMVPSLFLQPLVENAIRHGISRRASGGMVSVSAQPVQGKLIIRVEDDGVGLPQGWSADHGSGLGLSVTRERLAALYEGEAQMTIRPREDAGTAVEIVLPLRKTGDEDDAA